MNGRNEKVVIGLLKDYPQHAEEVISWLNKEFGGTRSERFYRSIVRHSMNSKSLPITFVAVEDNTLLGTVGIWQADLLSRQDLSPWISALVVNPKYRNEGVGKRLQSHAVKFCKDLGINEVFLYTDIRDYYEHLGWTKFEIGYEYSGNEVQIYKKV